MTNYELIKSMSIEEMAVTIMCPTNNGSGLDDSLECDPERFEKIGCTQCCLDWLKEEAASNYITAIELCSHCGHENELRWNLKDDGYQIHCAFCGEKLMLCSECLTAEDNPDGACPEYCFRKKLEEAE